MKKLQIDDLSVFASGVFPVEISVKKRINASHRVPLQASLNVLTGEVTFSVDPEAVKILSRDDDGR